MKERLENYIRLNVKNPRDEEIRDILAIFQEKQFSKGDIFKKAHSISDKLGFLVEGSARFFVARKNGDRTTANIIQQDKFMLDLISVKTREATAFGVEFLEASTALEATVEDMEALLVENLTFNILIREYTSEVVVGLGTRHLLFLNSTAGERYKFILNNFPDLIKKFPLQLIASMIGVTPTQLSRIRKKKED